MSINITKKDVIWSYFSLFLFNGVNIILLPFILAYLSSAEVGLWYTFTAVSGLVVILDFGFMTTLSRNVTFLWAGAEGISSTGFRENLQQSRKPNYQLFSKLFKTTRLIYLLLGLSIFIILLTVGSLYVYTVSRAQLPIETIIISWATYATAVFLNMRYAYWNAILKGIGAIKQNQQLLIVTKLFQLLLTVIGLILGFGLIGVAIAYLLSIIINRVLAKKIFYSFQDNKKYVKPLLGEAMDRKEYITIFKKILPNAYKQGLISISNYINLRSTTLISSAFLGLNLTASLGLVLQILSLITVVANTFFNTYLPQFSAYRLNREYRLLKKVFRKAIIINYFIIFTSFIVCILSADFILDILKSDVQLLPWPFILIIMLYTFLYNNQLIFATFIATKNYLPHYKAFFLSSLIVLGAQLFLMYTFDPTLWNLILPIFLVHLAYNNWKWPFRVIEEFKYHETYN